MKVVQVTWDGNWQQKWGENNKKSFYLKRHYVMAMLHEIYVFIPRNVDGILLKYNQSQ